MDPTAALKSQRAPAPRGLPLVARVACPGLAEAIDHGDMTAATEAIANEAERTPQNCDSVVLGCTHYPLVAPEILQTLPTGTTLYDSAEAVARQTLRRLDRTTESHSTTGSIDVVLSARRGNLPTGAHAHPVGRALAAAGRVPREILISAATRSPMAAPAI
ncbi:aspartate/glutamate racemase family protein [Streptomyces sp. NPDC058228]|uniref:aspartate/glutamate racemase family protein n=1 Tax=Streptomyces sp. NPDC058228 TaxID=3346390 RepID=UPI0036F16AA4